MAERRPSGVVRGRRRWTFAGCLFDEANWLLTVDGQRVAIESKPLELLRELLLRAGEVVAKDELLDTIWPEVTVVEASLPTAVGKLRRVLGDDRRDKAVIETVPRIGYRLAVPVEVEHPDESAEATAGAVPPAAREVRQRPGRGRAVLVAAALAVTAVALAAGLTRREPAATTAPPAFAKADIFAALRKTDVEAIERMLAAGWDPNASLDIDGNGAVNILLGNCEWDPGHDRRQLLIAARTLFDGGARVTDRNAWGDTPYSIAKAERYCGPGHPVTRLIHMMCYEGGNPMGDRCLADYRRNSAGKVIRRF